MWIPIALFMLVVSGIEPKTTVEMFDEFTPVVWVTSTNSDTVNVAFRMAYAIGDSSGFSRLEYVTGMTPKKFEFDKPLLYAMVSAADEATQVQVTIKSSDYRVSTGEASGSSSLNIVRSNGRRVAYGMRSLDIHRRN